MNNCHVSKKRKGTHDILLITLIRSGERKSGGDGAARLPSPMNHDGGGQVNRSGRNSSAMSSFDEELEGSDGWTYSRPR